MNNNDIQDLLAALTEEERAAISEHDADSPLGRIAEECRKLESEAVEVPFFWLQATAGGRVNVSESNDLWLWILASEPGSHAGLHISRKEALELANALLVAAAAISGIKAEPRWNPSAESSQEQAVSTAVAAIGDILAHEEIDA